MPDILFDARWSGVHNFSSCFENRDTWGWRWWAGAAGPRPAGPRRGPRATPRARRAESEAARAERRARPYGALLITVGEEFLFLQSRAYF